MIKKNETYCKGLIASDLNWIALNNPNKPFEATAKIRSASNPTEVVVYPLGHEGCNMIKPSKFLTPNGDNKNDRWIIENIEIYETVMVTIYDRYGKLVRYYDSYSNESGWDGYDYKNTKKPSDDYWYIINIPELDEVVSGHFSLIRK